MLLNSNSDMKGKLRSNKGRKWKGLHLSNNNDMKDRHLNSNLRLQWSKEEWNAGQKMPVARTYSPVMIITSGETGREKEEGMGKKMTPMQLVL